MFSRRWRRLCVDTDVSGAVIGASLEEYQSGATEAVCIRVLAMGEAEGNDAHRVLDILAGLTWYQDELPFSNPVGQVTVNAPPPSWQADEYIEDLVIARGETAGPWRWGLA